jgi:hypothetical protein
MATKKATPKKVVFNPKKANINPTVQKLRDEVDRLKSILRVVEKPIKTENGSLTPIDRPSPPPTEGAVSCQVETLSRTLNDVANEVCKLGDKLTSKLEGRKSEEKKSLIGSEQSLLPSLRNLNQDAEYIFKLLCELNVYTNENL